MLFDSQNKQETNGFKMNPKKWLEIIMDNPIIQSTLGYETRRNDIPSNIHPTQEEIEYYQLFSDKNLELSATTHDQQGIKATKPTQATT